ncbi:MAG: c-type cytochrome [Verrucomicrobia bacterium]|nr:c-type cytochrome [Verrucomicrobiota bacterium]
MRQFCIIAITAILIGACVSPVAADETADLYTKECAGCHGKDGKGRTPVGRKVGAKDLTLSKSSDAEMLKQINEGKLAKDGSQAMPAFKAKLDADEIKALMDFVKKFRK